MKKTIFSVAAATLMLCAAVGVSACTGPNTQGGTALSVYAPDGAPALALANLIAGEEKETGNFSYDVHVVDAGTIVTYVTGESPAADFCVLPVNAASLKLGTGETYRMLGTVTNGNLFFLSGEEGEQLTSQNLADALTGKKVGVVRLSDVPGLTLQATLAGRDIPYRILPSAGEEGDADKVNLIAFAPEDVTPAGGCDYYLCPEPAASVKIKGTSTTAKPFKMAGDLQELYGEGGYPQAVMVAKKSVIEQHSEAVGEMISYLTKSENYLSETDAATLVSLLDGKRTAGLAPSFTAANLTPEVVAHCSVRFTASKDCKGKVNAFLAELMGVNGSAAAAVSDDFYYLG